MRLNVGARCWAIGRRSPWQRLRQSDGLSGYTLANGGRMQAIAVVVVLVFSTGAAHAGRRSDSRISVFVTAPMRDGFLDADAAVLESINDIGKALRKSRTLRLAPTRDTADVVVTIMGRSVGPSGGAVGVPIGGAAVLVPINRRAIQWTLHVGDFETTKVSEDHDHDTWRSVADVLVKDLAAWVSANRDAVERPRSQR